MSADCIETGTSILKSNSELASREPSPTHIDNTTARSITGLAEVGLVHDHKQLDLLEPPQLHNLSTKRVRNMTKVDKAVKEAYHSTSVDMTHRRQGSV